MRKTSFTFIFSCIYDVAKNPRLTQCTHLIADMRSFMQCYEEIVFNTWGVSF